MTKSPERRAMEGLLSAESYIRITNEQLVKELGKRGRPWSSERKEAKAAAMREWNAKRKASQ